MNAETRFFAAETRQTPRAEGDMQIAAVAGLLEDPARAAMVVALCDGRALPAGELARLAHVAPSTASAHLAKLVAADLVAVEAWGRHRYYRLAGPELVQAIETLAVLAPPAPVRSLRQAEAAAAVRYARTCYDHLAGHLGVALTQALLAAGHIVENEAGYHVPVEGVAWLREFGVDAPGMRREPLLAPWHVDWSERRHHLAGPLAVSLTRCLFERRWLVRAVSGRAVHLTETGRVGLREHFGIEI